MTAFMFIFKLLNILADPSRHFILAFSLGALLFSVMWITSGISLEVMVFFGVPKNYQIRAAVGMAIISLLAALALALLSHVALDYFSAWFTTPLGPPLNIPNLFGPPVIPGMSA